MASPGLWENETVVTWLNTNGFDDFSPAFKTCRLCGDHLMVQAKRPEEFERGRMEKGRGGKRERETEGEPERQTMECQNFTHLLSLFP